MFVGWNFCPYRAYMGTIVTALLRIYSAYNYNKRKERYIVRHALGGGGVLRIFVALVVFQLYRDLEAGDNKSLIFKWRGVKSNPGPLAPQAKNLATRPSPLRGGGALWKGIYRRVTGMGYKLKAIHYMYYVITKY